MTRFLLCVFSDLLLTSIQDPESGSQDMDFSSNFEDPVSSQAPQSITGYPASKPGPIGQARTFQSHQPSPVSPLPKDLTEKIKSARQIWETPSMPSVAEHNSAGNSEESSNFHSGFSVADTFKSDSSTFR